MLIDPETGEVKLDKEGKEIKIVGRKNLNKYFNEHLDEWKIIYDAVYDKIKQKESPFIKSFEEMLNSKTKEVFSEDEINLALDEEGTL